MKNIWLTFVLIISVVAYSEAQQIKRLNVKEFIELMDKTPNKTILDVRTNGEVAQGVLPQATQIDYNGGNFETQLEKLDKNKPVFIYCAVGGRSGSACSILSKKGFKQVYNLEGGINAWRASGLTTTALKR
ncbi:MAG: rhodanese-like domain-containing protein [Emticicia sp.]|uniref:rhodanese-like domain-containing protein n=1 Tax=Emticicia sp. TaxID=1930953 RepID=UPI003BA74BD4